MPAVAAILLGGASVNKASISNVIIGTLLFQAITTTTREKRCGETNGVDYFFVSKEEFEDKISKNKLVEHSFYNGNYYGCGVDQVADNKIVVLDPNGLHSFKKLQNKNIVSFLLVASESTRKARMIRKNPLSPVN